MYQYRRQNPHQLILFYLKMLAKTSNFEAFYFYNANLFLTQYLKMPSNLLTYDIDQKMEF